MSDHIPISVRLGAILTRAAEDNLHRSVFMWKGVSREYTVLGLLHEMKAAEIHYSE